ncbi:MAG TPA: selenoneine biosynthesis selenosugar synthase SenB [Myxococcales bacterium]|nr:selenoneine biosynthesis selenosugar synthase SenB [Myxococcales bacterium]
MRVALICPAPRGSRLGNRVTALRWQRMLSKLGHQAFIATGGTSRRCDLLIALHAGRSAEAVRLSREEHPRRPLVVALTGTDLYNDIHQDPRARRSLELAGWLIVLHDEAARALPASQRRKARVVPQSAPVVRRKPKPDRGVFEVAVVAHLREVKDPLRTGLAVRRLPAGSRIQVVHAGKALTSKMRRAALREQRENPRYRWLGELPRWKARRLIARARLLAVTSETEGGANVLSEALAAGTPVIATRIDAAEAILGRSYPGLFPVGSTDALARLLSRAEREPGFLADLRRRCRARRGVVSERREMSALRDLLHEVARARVRGKEGGRG